jgi:hypothetical protein
VEVTVETSGKWVKYRPITQGLEVFPSELLKDPKRVLVSASEAKQYQILAYTGNDEGGADTVITVTFVHSPPNPPTPPIPTPDPPGPTPPGPNPPIPPAPVVVEGAWVIVVEETSLRTPAIAQILGETRFWKELPVAGVRFYDKDNEAAIRNKYDVMARQTGLPLPVMMVVDRNGKLIKAKTLPLDTTGVRAFVKETTGK